MSRPDRATQVATLLNQSWAAHQRGKQAVGPFARAACYAEARDLRVKAHSLDRKHTAPAWDAEQARTAHGKDTHAELMRFYARQISKAVA